MKTALMAGALAVSLWGGAAFAQDDVEPEVVVIDPERVPEDVEVETEARREGPDMSGVQVMLGGGVEGFTGDLAPVLNPGPAYGATVGIRPLSWLGVELGYSGALNGVDEQFAAGDQDIVKNGGQALATIGLPTQVQPYVAGGFGMDRYNVRDQVGAVQDDTLAYVPVGVGVRTFFGDFTADARVMGEGLISQDLVPFVSGTDLENLGDETPDARYTGMVRLGATF